MGCQRYGYERACRLHRHARHSTVPRAADQPITVLSVEETQQRLGHTLHCRLQFSDFLGVPVWTVAAMHCWIAASAFLSKSLREAVTLKTFSSKALACCY